MYLPAESTDLHLRPDCPEMAQRALDPARGEQPALILLGGDMSEYDDFAMRVRYLLSLSEKGQFPLRSETKAVWNRILTG